MTQIIQLDREELQLTIETIVSDVIRKIESGKTPILPDRVTDLNEVSQITGLRKSTIYKETAAGTMPVARFGKKLVFSRKQLLDWMESRTVKPVDMDSVLQKQALKRQRP
jgi:excisionase family DNA binding protein